MKLFELAIGLQINQQRSNKKVISENNKRSNDKSKNKLGSNQKRS